MHLGGSRVPGFKFMDDHITDEISSPSFVGYCIGVLFPFFSCSDSAHISHQTIESCPGQLLAQYPNPALDKKRGLLRPTVEHCSTLEYELNNLEQIRVVMCSLERCCAYSVTILFLHIFCFSLLHLLTGAEFSLSLSFSAALSLFNIFLQTQVRRQCNEHVHALPISKNCRVFCAQGGRRLRYFKRYWSCNPALALLRAV